MSSPGEQRGFSLLEVLVAFVIVALVATALFNTFGAALRNGAAAEEWSRALVLAESRLSMASTATPLREGTDQGVDDESGMRWQAEVKPYVPPDPNQDLERASETMPTRMYRIVVDVSFPGTGGRDRNVELATIKVAPRNLSP